APSPRRLRVGRQEPALLASRRAGPRSAWAQAAAPARDALKRPLPSKVAAVRRLPVLAEAVSPPARPSLRQRRPPCRPPPPPPPPRRAPCPPRPPRPPPPP